MALKVLGFYESYFYILVCNCDISPVLSLLYSAFYFKHMPTTFHPSAYVKFLINL